jgi:hypothetical protein
MNDNEVKPPVTKILTAREQAKRDYKPYERKLVNSPLGSTRKMMTPEESEWLKKFDQAFYSKDLNSLNDLALLANKNNEEIIKLKSVFSSMNNKRDRDITRNSVVIPLSTVNEEQVENILQSASNILSDTKEDVTLNPKKLVDRYTTEDYMQPFTSEDAILEALDFEHNNAKLKAFKPKDKN